MISPQIKWVWKNTKGSHLIYIVGMVLTVVVNFMQLIVPMFTQKIVDTFLSGADAAKNLVEQRDLFYWLIAGMIGVTVIRTILVYCSSMIYEHVSQRMIYGMRNRLFDKILNQDMAFYDQKRTGDLMTRLTGDLDAVRHMIAWVVKAVIEGLALFGSAVIYFFYLDWLTAICILAICPFIFLIIIFFKRKVKPMHEDLRERLANMNTAAQENISGNRVVRAFAREDYEISKFDEKNIDYSTANKKTALLWLKYYPIVETCGQALPIVLLVVGGMFLISGRLTMGQYVAFSSLIWTVRNPMGQLGNIVNEFQRFSAASKKVMEIDNSEPVMRDKEDAVNKEQRLEGRIEFDHVSFAYDGGVGPDGKGGRSEVLHDINFSINPGETVAIMGETGSGKTSLINLLPRFYDPLEGSIKIDGVDIRDLKLHQLRRNIGMASQDVLLYSDTIDNNIAYGNTDMPAERIHRYARSAAASDFIDVMPERYRTIIGERGVGLSGGQKQRISLARALAVEPSILILDDTTSAVDAETEKMIQDSLAKLPFTCTRLIIAQRISSTRTADKIIILEDGHITEMGTHAELLKNKGYYYNVFMLQGGGEVVNG